MASSLLQKILDSAAILDIETLDLTRGSGIHQIAVYDVAKRHVSQFYVEPNLQVITPETPQDVTRLATSPRDIVEAHPGLDKLRKIKGSITWRDVVTAQTLLDRGSLERVARAMGLKPKELRKMMDAPADADFDAAGKRTRLDASGKSIRLPNLFEKVEAELKKRNPFLYRTIRSDAFHYFADTPLQPTDAQLLKEIQAKGSLAKGLISYSMSMDQVLEQNSKFMESLKGKVIWIANASFEASQFGAQAAAKEAAVREQARVNSWSNKRLQRELRGVNPLRTIIQGTSTTTADALYVTGKEFLKVRRRAQITGDWTKVFRATLEHTEVGDVRDIIDVVKSQQSYLQKLGFIRGTRPGQVSMDVQARLYAFSSADSPDAAMKALRVLESHVAREDTSITEELVRRHSLTQTAALEAVHEGTDEGKALLAQARQGKGILHQALKYAQAYETLAPQLEEKALGQRLGRMFQDFAREGETTQTTGMVSKSRKQYTPSGRIITVDTAMSKRRVITDIDEAISHILASQQYQAADSAAVVEQVKADLISKKALKIEAGRTVVRKKKQLTLEAVRLAEESRKGIEQLFVDATRPGSEAAERLGRRLPTPRIPGQRFASEISEIAKIGAVKGFGKFAAAVTGLGLVWSLAGMKEQGDGPESIRTINYQKWLESQQSFSGMDAGYTPAPGEEPSAIRSAGLEFARIANQESWLDAQRHFSGIDNSHMRRDEDQPSIWKVAGLAKGGIAHAFRSQRTDFGSPYIGPEYSNSVFEQLDLLRRRERYLQSAFGAVHYGPVGGIRKYFNNVFRVRGAGASRRNHSFLSPNAYRAVPQGKYPGIQGDNLLEVDLRSGDWNIKVPDADTITLARQGIQIAKFRLVGIDAPETPHGGKPGQPYAIAGRDAARQMIANARNLSLVVDPSEITYGRTVGVLMADGKNVNLELVKRGVASYLPIRSKGKQMMFDPEPFEAAAKAAMASDKGMWKSPFFQVYRDVTRQADVTMTFNTLANPTKVASNSGLLSLTSLMKTAHQRGAYTSDLVQETAELAERIKAGSRKVAGRGLRFGGADYKSGAWKQIHSFSAPNSPHKTYMSQMMGEISQLLKTRGKTDVNPTSAKKLGRLDKVLSINSTQAGSLESKRQLHLNKIFGTRNKQMYYNTLSESLAAESKTKEIARQIKSAERKQKMAAEQRVQNQAIFNSPINHQRM